MTLTMERLTNPADIAAHVEATEFRRKAPKQAGHDCADAHSASPTKTSKRAMAETKPKGRSPAAGSQTPDAASADAKPTPPPPHRVVFTTIDPALWNVYHGPVPTFYTPDPAIQPIIDELMQLQRVLQKATQDKTKLINSAKATVRSFVCTDADYVDMDTETVTALGKPKRELTSAAKKRVDEEFKRINADPSHPLFGIVTVNRGSQELFQTLQDSIERDMCKLARKLPVYSWVKSVKGFGDKSFATIVGECGDIGSYKSKLTGQPSVSALWKRLGLAVFDGKRQGSPGKDATAQDWIDHGYNRKRRSVSWNARAQIIGGMGLWRPGFGEDVRANPELTEYQIVFAERVRYESEKLGLPIVEVINAKGEHKESYKQHAVNRAMRYTEKRLLKNLYLAWRRA